jgi:hypothetical protein
LTVGPDRTINDGDSIKIGTSLASASDTASAAALARTPAATKDVPNATVQLLTRSTGTGPWTLLKTVTTNAAGAVSTAVRPRHNSQYEWSYTGDGTYSAATSGVQTITVRQVVKVHHTATRIQHGHSVQIFGLVLPRTPGERVVLQRRSRGTWVKIAAAMVTKQRLPDGTKRIGYVFTYTARTSGAATLRVHVGARPRNAAANSSAFTLHVT